MTSSSRFLFSNGLVSHSSTTPPVTTFLESHPGAYTTTRSHNNGSCLLFWDRHLNRLSNSARILFNSNPHLLFNFPNSTEKSLSLPPLPIWDSAVKALVDDSARKVLPVALRERKDGEELAVTALVSGDSQRLRKIENLSGRSVVEVLDVCVHIASYVPPVCGLRENGARLAVVGHGRDIAEAKYSDWVRLRKPLENLRPPSVTELLLSNDGDQILEGCLTNFFVVCRKENNETKGKYFHNNESACDVEQERSDFNTAAACPFEVQTAPISDGVLPGVIRQLVIEVCISKGIPVREVAPLWSRREFWQEAFITNSLRILQHVEKIQVPSSWESIERKTLEAISWEEKWFGEDPGMITVAIQKEIMERASVEGYLL
ncbi:uncharacterized protein LOC110624398 isoform X2 [Manihot esculenta]|uniref:Aminotransferase class IV n=1 Tax=Manihot esculenta TaxID=3983 RepID=A0A2C9V357_MANES|nr:uncharacterized protein LOC110624398 isoform X2 [Manihot esculenta]OAY38781.1 hypothetical protein MANES_10G041400v8 [Manihot esculenta]